MNHEHSEWACPAHILGCECSPLHGTVCNPYRRAGYCPDDLLFFPAHPAINALNDLEAALVVLRGDQNAES